MLSKFGNYYELNLSIEKSELQQLQKFNGDWKPYNTRKFGFGREGLSLTSLDGQLSGVPDLDSLSEFNLQNNTNYEESCFKVRTPVVECIPSLQQIFDIFGRHISRSHFIKFAKGGFFPPHRDVFIHTQKAKTFRLFATINKTHSAQYHFVMNGQLCYFNPRTIYFINTMLDHSFVSFFDDLIILVLNIDENDETIELVQKHLAIK